MKVSNCLKLVLLCGCPPDNSNFQLQLGSQDTNARDESQTTTDIPEVLTRSDPHISRSNESINRIIKKCCFKQDSSDMSSYTCVPEISKQDEQKAIELILEYLEMEYSGTPKFKNRDLIKPPQQNTAESRWKAKYFKRSHSVLENRETLCNNENDVRSVRGKSLESNIAKIRSIQNKEKPLKSYSFKVDKKKNDIEIQKSFVKAPKSKAPFNFFKKLTNPTVLQSKTVVETSDIEIKEVIVSGRKGLNQKNKGRNFGIFNNNNNDSKCKWNRKLSNSKNNIKQKVENERRRLSDACVVLNPNIIDEVAPYVLRFVKCYLGDFRRYLLDTFIGVDSISLDYFDSMVNELEKFPIDDLTLFKNLKYTLAVLFPQKEQNEFNNLKNEKAINTSNKYEEKLQRKNIEEPANYKYTITTKDPISFDNSMGDIPSFIVKYHPIPNKLNINRSVQTEEIVFPRQRSFTGNRNRGSLLSIQR